MSTKLRRGIGSSSECRRCQHWQYLAQSQPGRAEELRSFDDYLAPKRKGRIGFSDLRIPGSGQSIWSFMWELKGEDYLKKMVNRMFS